MKSRGFNSRPFPQTGGTLAGVVLGLLVGLMVALGVAMYVTKAPMPFSSKTANGHPAAPAAVTAPADHGQPPPDPNTLLLPKEARDFLAPNIQVTTPGNAGDNAGGSAGSASGDATKPSATVTPSATAAGASNPATPASALFFLETGRFKSAEDAEQMRVRLVLASVEAQVVEVVTDSGSPYRVRVGPYNTAEEAYRARTRITENGFEARLVKVTR